MERIATDYVAYDLCITTEHGCRIVGASVKNTDNRDYVFRSGKDCNGMFSAEKVVIWGRTFNLV